MVTSMIISNKNENFNQSWLELLKHDPVHPVDEIKTINRRIKDDRLLFVMLHEDQPQAFLQIALCKEAPTSADQLWNNDVETDTPSYAVFYSIFRMPNSENVKGATRELIFYAVEEIKKLFQSVDHFITLSPIPSLTKHQIDMTNESIWNFINSSKDPVAKFHISNGAKPWTLWPNADRSKLRQTESNGWMISYDYSPMVIHNSVSLQAT